MSLPLLELLSLSLPLPAFLPCLLPEPPPAAVPPPSLFLRARGLGGGPPSDVLTSSSRCFSSASFSSSCSLDDLTLLPSSLRPGAILPDFLRQPLTYFSSSRSVEGLRVSKSISMVVGSVSRSESSRD